MGFYLRQWFLPWKATPWQSGFHFLVLAAALALLLLAVQVGVRSHFEVPAALQAQPGLVTTGARVGQQRVVGLPLLLARELAAQPHWQWASPVMSLFGLKPVWQGEALPRGHGVRLVDRGLFEHLRLAPVRGRGFSRQAEQAAREVVISHALWQQWFAGREDVLQQVVEADGQSFQLVGVLPPGFHGFGRQPVDMWFSLDMLDLPAAGEDGNSRLMRRLRDRVPSSFLLGRLRGGQNLAAWQQAAATFQDFKPPPLVMDGQPVRMASKVLQGRLSAWPGLDTQPEDTAQARQLSRLMLWISGSLALLVLAGLLLFLLEKLPQRLSEFRLRYSLGATSGRMLGQLAMENLLFFLPVLPLAWAMLHALFAALAAIEPFSRMIPGRISPPDTGLLAWAVGSLLLLAWLLAALPARYLGQRLVDSQRHHTRGRGWVWLGRALNGLQLTAAFLAVLLGLLFAGGVFALSQTGWVGRSDDLKILSWHCQRGDAFCKQLSVDALIEAMDGQRHEQVVVVGFSPLGPGWFSPRTLVPLDNPEQCADFQWLPADASLFSLPGMPRILAGHLPEPEDEQAVVASRSAVAMLGWTAAEAVDQQVALHYKQEQPFRIAAVVEDINFFDPRVAATATVWPNPAIQDPMRGSMNTLLWHGPESTLVLKARLEDALARLGVSVRRVRVETLQQRLEQLLGDDLRFARMVLLVAGFSLLVALLGIYASVLFALHRDRRALGIHLAFGATPARLLRLALLPYAGLSLLALLASGAATGFLQDWLKPWLLLLADQLPALLGTTVLLLAAMVGFSLLAGARQLIYSQPKALLQEE